MCSYRKRYFFCYRPSDGHGPRDRIPKGHNVRSKCQCSCVLQFTGCRAFCCVLHRPTSQVIHQPQAKGRVSTDRSVATALPYTTPRSVPKSSTDDSESRHRTPRRATNVTPRGRTRDKPVEACTVPGRPRAIGLVRRAPRRAQRLIKSHFIEPFDSRDSW